MKKSFLFQMTILSAVFFSFLIIAGCGGGGGGAVESGGSGGSAAAPKVVFVTSASGTGNLGSWAVAIIAGQTAGGLAAGDAICQNMASAAHLPGTYRAWLSTSTTDAYCHIQGYDGFKISDASGCGQSSMPTAAGPWVRTDGHPFADTIDKLIINKQVFAPVRYDQYGMLVLDDYYTGTYDDGTVATGPNTCSDWTYGINDASHYAEVGTGYGATGWWTGGGVTGCANSFRLLCMQTGTGGPLPAITAPALSKKVFVTVDTLLYGGNGDLSSWPDAGGKTGIDAGDAICQARASFAGLANAAKFKAWLSDDTHNAINRLALDGGPWYRLDGVKVAENITALKTVPLFTAISYSETGVYLDDYNVWTGTDASGNKTTNNCHNWGSSDGDPITGYKGYVGGTNTSDGMWTHWYDSTCNQNSPIYCFEDN